METYLCEVLMGLYYQLLDLIIDVPYGQVLHGIPKHHQVLFDQKTQN